MSNRHDRRARAAADRAAGRASPPTEKMSLVFHQPPEDASPLVIAMFLSAATHVHDLAVSGAPGPVTYPIHVSVEMGGKKMCGDIVPAQPDAPAGPGITVSPTQH